jgi:hypothetical protein
MNGSTAMSEKNDSCLERMTARARAFLPAHGGASILLFAFSLTMLIICIGVAIDMGRLLTARSQASSALDAALLGAAAEADAAATKDELTIRAGNYFNANYSPGYVGAGPADVDLDISGLAQGKLSGFTSIRVPLAFGNFLGISELDMPIGAQVSRFLGTNLEVALVLDFTGSMCIPSCAKKLDIMKKAAADLLEALQDAKDSATKANTQISVAFIPFVHGVKVDSPDNLKTVFELDDNKENPNPDTLFDATAYAGFPIVRGLTTDLEAVKTYLKDAEKATQGGTNTAAGMVMGWKALRPQNNPEFTGASKHQVQPKPFSLLKEGGVLKVMIVLSDGVTTVLHYKAHQNSAGKWINDSKQTEFVDTEITRSVEDAKTAAERAKAEGIQIYSIAFIPDGEEPKRAAAARELMRHTSSDPKASYYFEPTDAEELKEVFRDIASSLVDKIVTK